MKYEWEEECKQDCCRNCYSDQKNTILLFHRVAGKRAGMPYLVMRQHGDGRVEQWRKQASYVKELLE